MMERLLDDFPPHEYPQWRAAAEALLKGAPFDKKLVSSTYEGITLQPIHLRENGRESLAEAAFPGMGNLVRGSRAAGYPGSSWRVSQELRGESPEELRHRIAEGIAGGQTELHIPLATRAGLSGRGIRLDSAADLDTAFGGIDPAATPLWFEVDGDSSAFVAMYLAWTERRGGGWRRHNAGFGVDAVAELLRHGTLGETLSSRYDRMASVCAWLSAHRPGWKALSVAGDLFHDAGASAVQELGFSCASMVHQVGEMEARGIAPSAVFQQIRLRLGVGSDFLMEIAKIRAARVLWSRIAEAYGCRVPCIDIHATTSLWNKTRHDPHNNMLRATAEAFAAVIAGADGLHVGPFDEISGRTSAFSRRIARNIHTILREECGLDRVADPAGGSYSVEWLTNEVAAKSWELFQSIERRGGMANAVLSGWVEEDIARVREERLANIRRRKDVIVGVNMFPASGGPALPAKVAEASVAGVKETSSGSSDMRRGIADFGEAIEAARAGATVPEIGRSWRRPDGAPVVEQARPLGLHRASEEFEALRDACDAFAARTGSVPEVLQLNIGPSRDYRLRADWTAGFFGTVGLHVDASRDFADAAEAAAAAADSRALVAVITSTDEVYEGAAAAIAAEVKRARPSLHLLLAGTPGEREREWREAGIEGFVNVRSDNYATNKHILERIGVL